MKGMNFLGSDCYIINIVKGSNEVEKSFNKN